MTAVCNIEDHLVLSQALEEVRLRLDEARVRENNSRIQCETVTRKLAEVEMGQSEIEARFIHLARGFRKTGWVKQAEIIEGVLAFPTAGIPVMVIVGEERDRLQAEVAKLREELAAAPERAVVAARQAGWLDPLEADALHVERSASPCSCEIPRASNSPNICSRCGGRIYVRRKNDAHAAPERCICAWSSDSPSRGETVPGPHHSTKCPFYELRELAPPGTCIHCGRPFVPDPDLACSACGLRPNEPKLLPPPNRVEP